MLLESPNIPLKAQTYFILLRITLYKFQYRQERLWLKLWTVVLQPRPSGKIE